MGFQSLIEMYPKARDDRLSFPLDQPDLPLVSDQELARLFSTAPKLHEYGGVDVVRLSKSLVIKGGEDVALVESQNMIFAAESLHLPVPKVHRTFAADIPGISDGLPVKGHFIVMDYVPGPTVEECWDFLDVSQRQLVASQVAAMIETMQSTPLKLPPGPMGGAEGQKFEGPWFTDYGAGPFATLQDLEDWCNHKIDVCIRFKQLHRRAPRFRFQRVVLTHQDIAPRNLILDAQGKVWIIDWGVAGVYPPGFEQATLQAQSSWNGEFAEMVLARLSDRQERVQILAILHATDMGAARNVEGRGDPSETENPSISHLNVLVAPEATFRAEWSSNIDCVVLAEVQEVLLTLRDGYRPRFREIGAYR
ncbi:kinase-like domain-containing protein [Phialemonium atrogriseum]|uniref:Kinase-like domain-containing protein n=1 Tax=Phialemonium atrogriseum TaxID=1093897 RepID=A0AAJ0CBM6_9PEZI|nr:kinase-like domain-containing protein [Phialemonium atrogriseum]KAK1772249.1 kinase-like domain-containing protein [Phialemonium atrogriseum]